VCVPAGTRNHLAMDLGLDRGDVVAALDAFGEAVERRVDLGLVSGQVFVNSATVGLYAKIVQSPAYRDNKVGTALELLPEMLGPGAATFRSSGELARLLESVGGSRSWRPLGWAEWSDDRFLLQSAQPVEIGIDGKAMVLDPPCWSSAASPAPCGSASPATPPAAPRPPPPHPRAGPPSLPCSRRPPAAHWRSGPEGRGPAGGPGSSGTRPASHRPAGPWSSTARPASHGPARSPGWPRPGGP
jgi:hypothetical protein